MSDIAATTGKSPSYPMYPRDFLADVLLLNDNEELMYRRLLDYQWLHGGVPSDPKDRALAARMTPAKAAKAWVRVAPYFPEVGPDGGLRNRRMEAVRAEQVESRRRRQEAGEKGNRKRWNNTEQVSDGDRNAIAQGSPAVAVASATADSTTTTTAREAFVALVPEEYRPDVEAAIRASSRPDALVASLRMIVEGGEAVAYDHATIGQALREIAVAGRPITVNTIRAYCRNVGGRVSRETVRDDAETPGERVLRLAEEQDRAA